MACETAKEAWDTLLETFQGNERTRQIQVLNLRKEFEMLRMKEVETIKEYLIGSWQLSTRSDYYVKIFLIEGL